uniref:Uncharacterized protein LOC102800491 n=1 Tax=Saccoglossus kowalevskii TaxID=10224 RepID=A0ABM0MT16_SACKO
ITSQTYVKAVKRAEESQTIESSQCVASGDPHLTTFDQKHYTVGAECTYVLSKINVGEQTTSIKALVVPFAVGFGVHELEISQLGDVLHVYRNSGSEVPVDVQINGKDAFPITSPAILGSFKQFDLKMVADNYG